MFNKYKLYQLNLKLISFSQAYSAFQNYHEQIKKLLGI